MARPEKNNVEYFPFLCKEGKAMFYIENKYKNDGYATWVKILRQLAVTNNHWLNLSEPIDIMFLASKCHISEEVLIEIIDDLCKLGEFNTLLWKENRIIFSEKFIENIHDAYKKRSNECIDLNGLLLLLSSLGIRKLDKSESDGSVNPHSISYHIIEKNTISENKIVTADIKEIIFPFDSEEFKKKWEQWILHRQEIKKPYKSIKSQQSALDNLKKYSAEFSIVLITRSMTNGWQGLVFEKTDYEFKNFKHGDTNKGNIGGAKKHFGQL